MEYLFDAMFTLVTASWGRGLRADTRQPKPVEPTPWLRVAAGVLLSLVALVCVAAALLLVGALRALNDDLFGFVMIFFLPVAVAGAIVAARLVWWSVPAAIRTASGDGAWRMELGAVGAVAALIGFAVASVAPLVYGLLLWLPGLALVGVVAVPSVWRPVEPAARRPSLI